VGRNQCKNLVQSIGLLDFLTGNLYTSCIMNTEQLAGLPEKCIHNKNVLALVASRLVSNTCPLCCQYSPSHTKSITVYTAYILIVLSSHANCITLSSYIIISVMYMIIFSQFLSNIIGTVGMKINGHKIQLSNHYTFWLLHYFFCPWQYMYMYQQTNFQLISKKRFNNKLMWNTNNR